MLQNILPIIHVLVNKELLLLWSDCVLDNFNYVTLLITYLFIYLLMAVGGDRSL